MYAADFLRKSHTEARVDPEVMGSQIWKHLTTCSEKILTWHALLFLAKIILPIFIYFMG